MMGILKIADLLRLLMILAILSSYSIADTSLNDLLTKPGVAEQMQATYAGKKTSDSQQDTPLVKQARAFALRIDPPPPPESVKKASAGGKQPVRPQVAVSAKFKLIGTSYLFGDNSQSWALIDETGKGIHWVKQGSKVGYLVIEKVGDGKVLINDNGKKYEISAERLTKPEVVKSYTGILEEQESIVLMTADEKSAAAAAEANVTPAVEQPQPVVTPELSPEEQLKQTQESIEWLKKMQQDSNSAGMTDGEANGLGNLGNLLQTLENDAKQQQAEFEANSTSTTSAEANSTSVSVESTSTEQKESQDTGTVEDVNRNANQKKANVNSTKSKLGSARPKRAAQKRR